MALGISPFMRTFSADLIGNTRVRRKSQTISHITGLVQTVKLSNKKDSELLMLDIRHGLSPIPARNLDLLFANIVTR